MATDRTNATIAVRNCRSRLAYYGEMKTLYDWVEEARKTRKVTRLDAARCLRAAEPLLERGSHWSTLAEAWAALGHDGHDDSRRCAEQAVIPLVGQRPGMTSRELFETRLGAEAAARLGGQIAAIDAIGELWTGRRSLPMASADEVIAGLRTRHRQGCTMTVPATERRLVNAATKHFGTWRAAMEAAGLGHLVGRRTPKAGARRLDDAHEMAGDG